MFRIALDYGKVEALIDALKSPGRHDAPRARTLCLSCAEAEAWEKRYRTWQEEYPSTMLIYAEWVEKAAAMGDELERMKATVREALQGEGLDPEEAIRMQMQGDPSIQLEPGLDPAEIDELDAEKRRGH